MNIVFLGTASGTPTTQRNTTCIAFNMDQESDWFLFDCGEGTQRQLMRSGISISKISDIFISHLHGDHIFGLFGLIATRNLQQSNKPLNIYGPKDLEKLLKTVLELTKTTIQYDINFYTVEKDTNIKKGRLEIKPIPLKHGIETYGYYLIEDNFPGKFNIKKAKQDSIPSGRLYSRLKNKEIITLEDGRIIDGKDYVDNETPGRKVFMGFDNASPFILENELKNCDLLIHETTYTQEMKDKRGETYMHSTSLEVGEFADASKIPNLIVNHFSGRYSFFSKNGEPCLEDLRKEIKKNYKENFFLAKDFDKFHFDRNKKLIKI